MTSAKEAVRALREILEDGEFTYNSKVESRLSDVETAIANMTTRDLTDEEADAWAMRTIPAPAAHYYRRAIGAALLAANRGDIPSEVRQRPSAAAVGPFGQARGERVAPLESVHLNKETYEAARASGNMHGVHPMSSKTRCEASGCGAELNEDGTCPDGAKAGRGEAFAVITRVTARHADGSRSSVDLSDSPVSLHANDRIAVTRSPDGNVPLSITIGGPTEKAAPTASNRCTYVYIDGSTCDGEAVGGEGAHAWCDHPEHEVGERAVIASDATHGQPTKALVPVSLRVFRFRGYACICPRAADVCAIDIAAGTLWNDSGEPRRYYIAVVGYEGTEAAEHFTADPPGASVFSMWPAWFSEVMLAAGAEYMKTCMTRERARRLDEVRRAPSDVNPDGDVLEEALCCIRDSFGAGTIGDFFLYISSVKEDIEARLTGLPGKVPE